MALTATIRNLVMGLIALLLSLPAVQPVIEFLDKSGIEITPEFLSMVSLAVAGTVSTFILGLVTYLANKLGGRFTIINQILSLGRAKSPAAYVPNGQESVTMTTTPNKVQTDVVVEDAGGKHLKVAV
jgi:hypothetical protein